MMRTFSATARCKAFTPMLPAFASAFLSASCKTFSPEYTPSLRLILPRVCKIAASRAGVSSSPNSSSDTSSDEDE